MIRFRLAKPTVVRENDVKTMLSEVFSKRQIISSVGSGSWVYQNNGLRVIRFIEGCTQLDVVVRQNIYIHKKTYLLLINAYYKLWTLLHSQALIEGAR